MKYLFFLIFTCQVLIAQNVQFSVKDSITKKPIGYVNLRINNKYQMVSNENGEFSVDDASIHTFEFSCMGYVDKLIQRADLASDVFLTPSVTKLKEVVVNSKPKLKPKSSSVSAETHQDFSKSFTSNHSMSLAFFVEGALNESYLEAITIPIMPLNLKAPSHSSHYKTVIAIETLEATEAKTPGGYYYNFKQIAVIDSEKSYNKVEIVLDEPLSIPENGFFVQITILGKADNSNKLILEMPYHTQNVNGKEMNFIKLMKPYFPLVKEQKGVTTFIKIRADLEQAKWNRINWPVIDNSIIDNPVYNIGFGYTKKVYK